MIQRSNGALKIVACDFQKYNESQALHKIFWELKPKGYSSS